MKKTIQIICLIVAFTKCSTACSCLNPPSIFTENIKANHIIFSAEIIEHIEFSDASFSDYYGLTKLNVEYWFQNKMKSDTVYYANGEDGMCFSSLDRFEIGSRMVFKVVEIDNFKLPEEVLRSTYKNLNFNLKYHDKPVVGYEICDEYLLSIEEETIIGNITKNINGQNWKIQNILRKINESLGNFWNKISTRNNRNKQSMKFDKFKDLMKRKWDSL